MYQRILVPLDGSPTAERGLQEAMHLAAGQRAKLVLLHVVDDFPLMVELASAVPYDAVRSDLRRYGDELLLRTKAQAAADGLEAETLLREVMQGRVADMILEEAAASRCDLIVMGTHGRRGLSRVALGSTAEQVARSSRVPVLLVRTDEAKAKA